MRGLVKKTVDFFSPNLSAWLLGFSALLAVLLCYLPIPAFVFGQEGSGSTSAGCDCSVNGKCNDWSYDEDASSCTSNVWTGNCTHEDIGFELPCTENDNTMDKNYPKTVLYYHDSGCDTPLHTEAHNPASDPDEFVWKRDLSIVECNNTGDKNVSFTPKTKVKFCNFDIDNICDGSSGRLQFAVECYAMLYACNGEHVDNSFGSGESAGWTTKSYTFEYKSDDWVFTQGPNPWTTEFSKISAKCVCSNEDISEEIRFKAKVTNNEGVTLGKDLLETSFLELKCIVDKTSCK